jgi:hypothetical protein
MTGSARTRIDGLWGRPRKTRQQGGVCGRLGIGSGCVRDLEGMEAEGELRGGGEERAMRAYPERRPQTRRAE